MHTQRFKTTLRGKACEVEMIIHSFQPITVETIFHSGGPDTPPTREELTFLAREAQRHAARRQ